jgi:light-regulated signal transduction histidine kinase (bacteriophytochrome)
MQREPLEKCQLRRVLETGESAPRIACILRTRTGKEVFVEDAATPIKNGRGVLTGAVSVFADVTERRRFEEERERLVRELERSNADLARFSHAVSHDLQSPLRTINSFTGLLARRASGRLNAKDKDLLDAISRAAVNMDELIRTLLAYAQAGQRQLELKPVAVAKIVEEVLSSLAPLIAETGAEITVGNLPVVEGDRVQLQQLFQNLVTNSMKYGRPDEPLRIEVSAEHVQGGWCFAVRDNGQGIPPEHFQQIFEPLKRLHEADIPGTGLGLSLCRTIVDRHGGRIWVESDGAGRGATFNVFLKAPI